MRTFLKTRYRGRIPANAPVLLRVAFVAYSPQQWTDEAVQYFKQHGTLPPTGGANTKEGATAQAKRNLRRYPANVTYYGPLAQSQVPGLLYWLREERAKRFLAFAFQIVPIAPQTAGHHWPHTNLQVWTAYEGQRVPTYKLSRLSPTVYQWRRAA